MTMSWFMVGFGIVVVAILGIVAYGMLSSAVPRRGSKPGPRDEALFTSMFPELQPYFHPVNVVEFVRAHRARGAGQGNYTWKNPPGFRNVAAAAVTREGAGEMVRLLDVTGAILGTFHLTRTSQGGELRIGKGKLKVDASTEQPNVSYWHPSRQFKWSKRHGWKFITPVADNAFSADDDDRHSYTSSSYDPADRDRGETFEGRGGTFDGGGASGSWDDRGSSSASSSGSSSSDFASVESGSSSTASSTGY